MPFAHRSRDALQVIEAAQKAEVVARTRGVLLRDQIDDRFERTLAVAPARRHVMRHMHIQLLRPERSFDVEPAGVGGQAEHVAIEMLRAERAGEYDRRARGGVARLDERRGNHVAHANLRGGLRAGCAVRCVERHVDDRMIAELLDERHEMQCVEIKTQRVFIDGLRGFRKLIANRCDQVLQRRLQFWRHVGQHLVRGTALAVQRIPFAIQAIERLFERCWRGMARAAKRMLIERRAVHAARAVGQIVRFVGKHRDTPAV